MYPLDTTQTQVAVLSVTNGTMRVALAGEPYQPYRIEVSSDLSSWTTLQEKTASADGTLTLEDSVGSGATHRFYRARLVSP